MNGGTALALRYIGFAGLATLANLGVQRLVLAVPLLPAGQWLLVAMAAGTLVGLVIKYLLDKRFIFADRSRGLAAHGRRFSAYAGFGLFTTLLFWGFEAGFWWLGGTTAWREAGAVIGLAIGYAIKYRLDRRFVFTPGAA